MAYRQSQSTKSTDDPFVSENSEPMTVPAVSSSSTGFLTMLPGAVRNRLATIPSLRRSLSAYTMRSPKSNRRTGIKRPYSDDLSDCELYSEIALRPRSADEARLTSVDTRVSTEWKYASQGLNLLESAVSESQYPDKANQALARQLYIHGISYLLKGLPAQLSEAEQSTLEAAIPSTIQNRKPKPQDGSRIKSGSAPSQPSILHRVLASTIVQLFLLLSFLLPYLKLCLHSAYKYERTNRISEKVFATSLDAVDTMGKGGFGLADSILKGGNGRVARLLAGAVHWWIDGVAGGIQDGVGAGMAIMGVGEPG